MAPSCLTRLKASPTIRLSDDLPVRGNERALALHRRHLPNLRGAGSAHRCGHEGVGPGQFEINLKHSADAVAAALDGLLLKRAVKAAAEPWARSDLHGQAASRLGRLRHAPPCEPDRQIRAEPFRRRSDLSALPPRDRRPARQHGDFMAVWAQSANAYRRYVPKAYVSLAAHWGFNNRTVALRIPRGHGSATRIEHRVAGADANPYLVLAAILAGTRHGITNKIEPGRASKATARRWRRRNCRPPGSMRSNASGTRTSFAKRSARRSRRSFQA